MWVTNMINRKTQIKPIYAFSSQSKMYTTGVEKWKSVYQIPWHIAIGLKLIGFHSFLMMLHILISHGICGNDCFQQWKIPEEGPHACF